MSGRSRILWPSKHEGRLDTSRAMNLPPDVSLIDELRSEDCIQTLRAQPPGDANTVIIKIIGNSDRGSRSAMLQSRLEAWQETSHPSILRPTSVRGSSDRLVLVLPDIPTGSLSDRIRMGAVSSLDIGEICHQACSILETMHAVGFAHGNLKPSNLLIDLDGDLMVSDPLLMPYTGSPHADSSSAGHVFLAPEVIGGGPPSPAADQYSLALILLALLTGHPPDQAARVLANIAMNGSKPAPGRASKEPYIPAQAVHALRRALTVDPQNRWSSLQEFNHAFQRALGHKAGPDPTPRPKPEDPAPLAKPSGWKLAAPALAVFLCMVLSVPAYTMGLFDRGWEVLGSLTGAGPVRPTRGAMGSIAAASTPTPQTMAYDPDPDPVLSESALDDDPWNSLIERGESLAGPTVEQGDAGAPGSPAGSPTPVSPGSTHVGDSQPPPSSTKAPASTAPPTSTTDAKGPINPNSCKTDDPQHPRYCTPTPGP